MNVKSAKPSPYRQVSDLNQEKTDYARNLWIHGKFSGKNGRALAKKTC
jgi:hypothetical protein